MTAKHPYIGLPDYQFWKHEPAVDPDLPMDPVVDVSFSITTDEPVVTAGSCFAQHVARALARAGFNFHVTEKAHEALIPKAARLNNYTMFSARYGNIYTARQLKQLLQRAYREYVPTESVWIGKMGSFVDPFRPQIQPGGFISTAELERDRDIHLAAVRRAVESLSVFVFTLGLTEAWIDQRDGAVFPLAPGVAGGVYDEEIFAFKNFTVAEIVADMQWSLDFIRARNPNSKFILTVSPVPLNATYLNRHVFVSTTLSKSILRVAAEEVTQNNDRCDYFPSYEIITSPFARGRSYAPDCREVRPIAVAEVMRVFMKHYAGIEVPARMPKLKTAQDVGDRKSNDSARDTRVKSDQRRKQKTANSRSRGDVKEATEATARKAKNRRAKAPADSSERLDQRQKVDNLMEVLCDEEAISNK
ncbi:MAG: GSCFA domain-containing protein [Pseudomonadota bacterium]